MVNFDSLRLPDMATRNLGVSFPVISKYIDGQLGIPDEGYRPAYTAHILVTSDVIIPN